MSNFCVWLMVLLLLKHLAADLLLQTAWMVRNKGNLFHIAGYVHAAIHAVLTAILLGFFMLPTLAVCVAEFIVHYAIDFTKAKLDTFLVPPHKQYWTSTIDQALHFLTYIIIAWWVCPL